MKILIFSDLNNPHSIKWINSLNNKGIKIKGLGLTEFNENSYDPCLGHLLSSLSPKEKIHKAKEGSFKKLLYLKSILRLKKEIKSFKPDILHSHYATSYGLLGALMGFSPNILSVWGSDIYDFPKKSFLHRKVLEFNLRRADTILSTSHAMAKETNKFTHKEVKVTPFGVDTKIFCPIKVSSPFNKDCLVIGIVKTLEEKYGVEYLIRAFIILRKKYAHIRLLIVGGGILLNKFSTMVEEHNLGQDVIFTGRIPYKEVQNYHNMIDIEVIPSILDSESFGVSAVEAMACEKPLIVSNVGGLPEVVIDGVTGIVVPPKDSIAIANSLENLINNPELRTKLGKGGRKRVKELYEWDNNVNLMISIYEKILRGQN
jgi:glycosyltransferase involved in cell wall biosynthesis